jgi:UDP-N-acetylglucosamine 4,6-dehydratase/5-epimerase
MRQTYPSCNYVIGDIRDAKAVCNVIKGHDVVYHLAALKHIDICEQQSLEAVKTNIVGTMNVLQACKYFGVQMINMSTDKAANPLNVYGRTKRLAEDLVRGYALTIRSGNVVGSSGSLVPNMIKSIQINNYVTLTDEHMTRFFITLDELSIVLMDCIQMLPITGVFIAGNMKSFYIKDIIDSVINYYGNNQTHIKIIGRRPGEQLREYLNAEDETVMKHECGLWEIQSGAGQRVSSDDCLGTKEDIIKMFEL